VKVKELLDFLIDKQILAPEFPIRTLEKWDKETLPELYRNKHSWAGDQGCVACLVKVEKGQPTTVILLKSGGWYSDNGRTTRDDPNENCYEQLIRAGSKPNDIIIIHKWDNYNQPTYEFSDYYYHKVQCSDIEKGEKIVAELENREL